MAIGHDPRSELLIGQVDLNDEGYVLVEDRSTRTNLPGVFASGDLVDHTGAGTGTRDQTRDQDGASRLDTRVDR